MSDKPEPREISPATLAEMVHLVEPGWAVVETAPVDRGFSAVYRIVVEDTEGTEELYLKASPDGEPWSIPTDARIQAVLHAQTSIPVPEVVGVTDDHNDLPTPYYLMRARPGEEVDYEAVGSLPDGTLQRLARETGRYLGELHSIPAVDRFGPVGHDGPTLVGERPSGNPGSLAVTDGHDAWPAYLRQYVDRVLDRHADSRFADLTPELRRWLDAEIAALEGPFEPVLARNDHGLHNLLVDPETGAIRAMPDWAYSLATTAAFDVEFAVYLYSGAFLAGLPDVSDRRPFVREAILAGYRESAPERTAALSSPEPIYELLAMIRVMADFAELDLPAGTEVAAAERLAADARSLLDG